MANGIAVLATTMTVKKGDTTKKAVSYDVIDTSAVRMLRYLPASPSDGKESSCQFTFAGDGELHLYYGANADALWIAKIGTDQLPAWEEVKPE